MSRELLYPIPPEEEGKSVMAFLRARGYSRHLMNEMKVCGKPCVTVNGEEVYFTRPLSAGDVLRVELPPEPPCAVPPSPLPLSVVYEDEDILVADKPAGMPTHPSMDNHGNTFANALSWHYNVQGKSCACRIINRLDRDTSGLLVVAKHLLSASVLASERPGGRPDLHRTYLAIASGELPDSGVIDAPIGRAADSVIARRVDPLGGERAVTHYRALARGGGLTLAEVTLETGRTHQIRVHFAHIGHPLIGDFLYHPDFSRIGRQALHSWKLTFPHPITGEMLSFTCPPPPDMAQIIRTLTPQLSSLRNCSAPAIAGPKGDFMEKITSFTIDHIRLIPGIYVSRRDAVGDQTVTTFDLRITSPNDEPVMNTAEVHTIEHLGATFLRNHPAWSDRVLYFGPMGCRTGFYLLLAGDLSSEDITGLIRELFVFIRDYEGEVPGACAKDCGNYLDMNLPMAKYLAGRYIREVLDDLRPERLHYPK